MRGPQNRGFLDHLCGQDDSKSLNMVTQLMFCPLFIHRHLYYLYMCLLCWLRVQYGCLTVLPESAKGSSRSSRLFLEGRRKSRHGPVRARKESGHENISMSFHVNGGGIWKALSPSLAVILRGSDRNLRYAILSESYISSASGKSIIQGFQRFLPSAYLNCRSEIPWNLPIRVPEHFHRATYLTPCSHKRPK